FPKADRVWLEEVHAFAWLRHYPATGEDVARHEAPRLVDMWIDHYRRWAPLAWRPDLLGRRLLHWLSQTEWQLMAADNSFRQRFLTSVWMQARHLDRAADYGPGGAPVLTALCGLVAAALALTPHGPNFDR